MDEKHQEVREEGSWGDEFVAENVEEQRRLSAQYVVVQHSEVPVEDLSLYLILVSLQDSVLPFLAHPSNP